MKDYRLSELKQICLNNSVCARCPLCNLCAQLDSTTPFRDLEIDEEGDNDGR